MLLNEILVLFVVFIIIIATIIAAIFDFKYKIIPNKLTFSLIFFGLFTNLVFSILFKEIRFISYSIIITLIVFTLSYFSWKFGFWGGGDVKLFTAIAAVLPVHPIIGVNMVNIPISSNIFSILGNLNFINADFPVLAIYPFPFTVIINSILISFPFLFLFVFINFISNSDININNANIINNNNNNIADIKENKCFYSYFKDYLNIFKISVLNSFLIYLKETTLKKLLISLLISFISITLISHFKSRMILNINNISLLIIFGILAVFFSFILSFFIRFFIKKFKIIIKNGTKRNVAIIDLKERKILDEFKINAKNELKCILGKEDYGKYNLNIKNYEDTHVFKSKTSGGLIVEDIILLNKLRNTGLIKKYLPIKIGIPFGPSIAIGLIIAIFLGDISTIIFNFLNNFF